MECRKASFNQLLSRIHHLILRGSARSDPGVCSRPIFVRARPNLAAADAAFSCGDCASIAFLGIGLEPSDRAQATEKNEAEYKMLRFVICRKTFCGCACNCW